MKPAKLLYPPTLLATAARHKSLATLPADLLETAAKRLGYTSLLVPAVAFCMLFLTTHSRGFASRSPVVNTTRMVIWALAIVLSLGVFAMTRLVKRRWQLICDIGLAYEIVIGFLLSLIEYAVAIPTDHAMRGISVVCLWMVIFRLVVPTPPYKAAIGAFMTASTGPLALLVSTKAGVPPPPEHLIAFLMFPNYLTCLVSMSAAQIVYRMGTEVSKERELGSYQINELIGSGGMGEVRRAKHRMLARMAAIKLIRPEVFGTQSAEETAVLLRRFEREAQVTASLQSPHTVELFDFGVAADGSLFYVMELLEGMDLEKMVRKFGPLEPSRVIYLLRQVCDSLDDAHFRGLVHRDIKPANIFACKRGKSCDFVKVLDFGLVKVDRKQGWGTEHLTATNAVQGTPAYIAPETVTSNRDVDARTDLYSLGCVAYYLLTGRLVFEEPGPVNMAIAHVTVRPQPPSERTVQKIPASLEQLIMACLEKRPEDRPQSAVELSARLAACDEGSPWTRDRAEDWWKENLPELFDQAASELHSAPPAASGSKLLPKTM